PTSSTARNTKLISLSVSIPTGCSLVPISCVLLRSGVPRRQGRARADRARRGAWSRGRGCGHAPGRRRRQSRAQQAGRGERRARRRLGADPMALVLTVREGEPSLLAGADLRVLHAPGLGRSDAAELLGDVHAEAAERLYRATGGNPLALLELAEEGPRLAAVP